MRNLKKVLSLVLCMAMMLSVMVVGAGAAFKDQEKIVNTEAVDMCVALNIINGYTDGSYKPEGNVTRAEMCKMICIALNGGKEPSLGTNATPSFTDIDGHWAEGYIESCVAQGIVAGIGGGKFNPNGNVTGSQAAKMLLIALGYSANDEGFVGNAWEVNVNVKATQKDLYDDLESMDVSAPLTRDNAAQMIWNALQAKEVKYTYTLIGNGGNLSSQVTVEDKNSTLLYSKYNGIILETTLEDVSYNSDKGEWTYTTGTGVAFGDGEQNVKVERDFTGDVNYCDLYKQAVKVVYTVKNGSVDDFLGMVSDAQIIARGVIGDIDAVAAGDDEVTINDVDYKLDKTAKGSVKVYPYLSAYEKFAEDGKTVEETNIKSLSVATDDDTGLCGAFTFWAIDNNDDNRIDRVVYVPAIVGQIDYLSSTSITISNTVGNKDLDDVNLYDGADEDDWVVVIPAANTDDDTMAITKAEIVSGEVTRIKGTAANPTDVQVNGTWYEVYSNIKGDTIKVNDSYDLTVMNGYVFSAEKTAGNVSASNILYIDKCAALTSGLADGVEAKVYFADGTSNTVTITEITKTDGEDYDVVANNDTGAKESDEIFASEAVSFLNGHQLFTYSEKNGEYSVEPVHRGNVGSYDDYMTLTATDLVDGKTNNGTRFAEDAVIFVKESDGDIVVKTGSTVSNWKDIESPKGEAKDAISVAGLYDESNGYNYIAIGFIDLKNSNASSDARVYGYITSSITSGKEDGTNYLYFDMWNGEETIEVKVEDKSSVDIAKYDFVAFDWADEAANEADTKDFDAYSAFEKAVAVKAYVTGDTIKFVNKNGTETANYEFADDYFIIGVDTKNGKGAGAKLATAKDCQEVGATHNDGLYANAIYFLDNTGDVEAVFVDVNGMLYTEKNGNKICTCVPVVVEE